MSVLTNILIPFGSLLVASVGLLVQNVPLWITATVVFFVIVIALFAVVPALIRLFGILQQWARSRVVRRRYRPVLDRFLSTLMPQLSDSRAETVFMLWRNFTTLDKGRRLIQPDQTHLATLQWWLQSIEDRLARYGHRDFERLAEELARAVLQYNRVCEEAHREIQGLLGAGVTDEPTVHNLKQEWNSVRDRHNQTIKTWEDIAKNINHDAGKAVCLDHYSLLKTLG